MSSAHSFFIVARPVKSPASKSPVSVSMILPGIDTSGFLARILYNTLDDINLKAFSG
jgi:hypothetical protein